MAETVAPSVRGRARILVGLLLAASSAATAVLAGAFAGALWHALDIPALTVSWLGYGVLGALLADRFGIPPLSVRKQVPQIWGRLFSAPVVAVIYGARLGVGPLTILNTWLWWVAFVVGASAGIGVSAVVGASFGVTRALAMLVAGDRLSRVAA